MDNETSCNHVGCLSWHNSTFKIVDNLAVLFTPNFMFPLISTKELEMLFFSSKERYFKCTALEIPQYMVQRQLSDFALVNG